VSVVVKGIVYLKINIGVIYPSTCCPFDVLSSWNTKAEVWQYVYNAVFHIMKVNGDQHLFTELKYPQQ